jgi:hypothetical protein
MDTVAKKDANPWQDRLKTYSMEVITFDNSRASNVWQLTAPSAAGRKRADTHME